MKLQKNIDTKYGVVANFSVLHLMNLDYKNKIATLFFKVYADEQSYNDNKPEIDMKEIVYNETTDPTFTSFEEDLKTKNVIKKEVIKSGAIYDGATEL